jgi:hypothetical protein
MGFFFTKHHHSDRYGFQTLQSNIPFVMDDEGKSVGSWWRVRFADNDWWWFTTVVAPIARSRRFANPNQRQGQCENNGKNDNTGVQPSLLASHNIRHHFSSTTGWISTSVGFFFFGLPCLIVDSISWCEPTTVLGISCSSRLFLPIPSGDRTNNSSVDQGQGSRRVTGWWSWFRHHRMRLNRCSLCCDGWCVRFDVIDDGVRFDSTGQSSALVALVVQRNDSGCWSNVVS